ncbi:MAG: acetylglutamate kinase [Acidimicrobiales bacterium]
MRRVVVKVGGHALGDTAVNAVVLCELARDVAGLRADGTQVAVVHGGGPQITELLDRLGLAPVFHEGLRVTDAATVSAVAMALSWVNLQIVSAFNHAGLPAVGLTGGDDALLTSTPLGEPWGRVGGAPRVRTALVTGLWSQGITPVIQSIAIDAEGAPLNVNADAVAGALAGALNADALVLLSDVDQVRTDPDDPATAVARLTGAEVRELVASGRAREGMRPKLLAALDALDGGAGSVTLANGTHAHALREVLGGSAAFTEVVP